MEPQPERDAALWRLVRLLGRNLLLQRDRAAESIAWTFKHGHESVASVLYDVPAMRNDGQVDNPDTQSSVTRMRLELGRLHQSRVADNIGDEDGPDASLELRH